MRYGGYLFSVAGARVAGILITSVTFPYLVRRLGVETYGRWSYIIALCAFLDLIADPGITSYSIQQVASRRDEAFKLIPDILCLRLLTTFLAIAILVVAASFEVRCDLRQLLRLYGVGILLVNLISADHFLTALEMFHRRSMLTVLQQVLYGAGIFCLIHSPHDILWLPVTLLISTAIAAVLGWYSLRSRGLQWKLAFRPGRWKGILVPGLHYASATLMSNVYHRSGHLLVRWFLGDYALGLYAAAVRFVDLLRGFVIVSLQVLMPRLAVATKSVAELRRLATVAVTAIALISIPLACGLVGTANLIVPWLLGAPFVSAIPLVQWMAPYLITASAASLFAGTILFSAGRHRAYLASTAGGAVAGLVFYLILISAFGLKGAAVAFVLAELVVAGIAFGLLPELRDSWKNPALAISAGAALLMLISVKLVILYTSGIFTVVSVGITVYALACGWFVRRILIGQRSVPQSA